MLQYLKHEPSLLSKVVDYLAVCVNDFADAHGLACPDAQAYLSKCGELAPLNDRYEAEHLLSFGDIECVCFRRGNGWHCAALHDGGESREWRQNIDGTEL